jgi:hypothetical protein
MKKLILDAVCLKANAMTSLDKVEEIIRSQSPWGKSMRLFLSEYNAEGKTRGYLLLDFLLELKRESLAQEIAAKYLKNCGQLLTEQGQNDIRMMKFLAKQFPDAVAQMESIHRGENHQAKVVGAHEQQSSGFRGDDL